MVTGDAVAAGFVKYHNSLLMDPFIAWANFSSLAEPNFTLSTALLGLATKTEAMLTMMSLLDPVGV